VDINCFGNDMTNLDNNMLALKNKNVKSWIIDLRKVTGARVEAVCHMAGYFFDQGETIGKAKYKNGIQAEIKASSSTKLAQPVILIIDNSMPGEFETLLTAVKNNNSASVIGTRTNGTGIISQTFTLANGNAIQIPVASGLDTAGNPIPSTGVDPDLSSLTNDPLELASFLLKNNEQQAIDSTSTLFNIGPNSFNISLDQAKSVNNWTQFNQLIGLVNPSQISIKKHNQLYPLTMQDLDQRWPVYFADCQLKGTITKSVREPYTVKFSADVNWSTAAESIELIESKTGKRIATSLNPQDSQTLEIVPLEDLQPGQEYWLTINKSIKSQHGSLLQDECIATIMIN